MRTLLIVVLSFSAGIVVQQIHDERKAPITVRYGASFAYAHVYMPPCADGQYRVVDAPERDERDALTVYCYDGKQATKTVLEILAGNRQ